MSRCGTTCSIRTLAGILFEDTPYDIKQAAYVRKILSSMTKTLREAGAEQILQKSYNAVSLDISKLDCDYYRFQNGEIAAVNQYRGEFMAQYSWAEFITGYIEQQRNS